MTIWLSTPESAFLQDMADVFRLFYGDAPIAHGEFAGEPSKEVLAVVHRAELRDGLWKDTFSGAGKTLSFSSAPQGRTEVEKKRLRKRQVKLGLYALLREITGMRPAWGSLTGIRPSRLLYEQMAEGKSPEEAAKALVDVFDVSPSRAALLVELETMQRGLRVLPEGTFDLYIGIPFCKTRCLYCSFSSGEIGDGHLVEPYVEALLREMDLCRAMIEEKGMRLRAGYVGGGTPTAIPRPALEKILDRAKKAFPGAVEWTVEAGRPDTIDRDMLQMLRDSGVTRISVNPQTFSDATLRRIGRAHTGEDTIRAFALARKIGFDDINMDLIAALPGEDLPIFSQTLDRVLDLAPDSVTVHTLAVKRSSKLHEQLHLQGGGQHGLPPEGEALRMTESARSRLSQSGYFPYYLYRQKYMAGNLENVGYARQGKACLYNIGNMEETASVLALGAGAITKWLFDRELRIERAPNVKNIEAYIARVEEMARRKRKLLFSEESGEEASR